VLFVSFVVKAFFTARFAQDAKDAKKERQGNVFLPAGQPPILFLLEVLASFAPSRFNIFSTARCAPSRRQERGPSGQQGENA
jgi:hypothetical protein